MSVTYSASTGQGVLTRGMAKKNCKPRAAITREIIGRGACFDGDTQYLSVSDEGKPDVQVESSQLIFVARVPLPYGSVVRLTGRSNLLNLARVERRHRVPHRVRALPRFPRHRQERTSVLREQRMLPACFQTNLPVPDTNLCVI